jgi:hypothetical protein
LRDPRGGAPWIVQNPRGSFAGLARYGDRTDAVEGGGSDLCIGTRGRRTRAGPSAAAIAHSTLDGGVEAIVISGDILDGDDERFAELSRRFPRAVVYLDSAGGALMAAIEIGKLVHARPPRHRGARRQHVHIGLRADLDRRCAALPRVGRSPRVPCQLFRRRRPAGRNRLSATR